MNTKRIFIKIEDKLLHDLQEECQQYLIETGDWQQSHYMFNEVRTEDEYQYLISSDFKLEWSQDEKNTSIKFLVIGSYCDNNGTEVFEMKPFISVDI